MSDVVPTICRLCIAHCGVLAEIEDDNGRRKVTRVTGDPDNPLFRGYTCPKGRALPELHNHDGRLLHSMKRQADGSHSTIDSSGAAIEVADRIKAIVDEYGPRAVAFYVGTPNAGQPTAAGMGNAFMRAIGSRMFFTSNTIDQPGKQISMALHGKWLGGEPDFEQADAWLLVGNNPIISKSAGIPGQNPAQRLKEAQQRGLQLIVVDPRVSDCARKAAIHLQCRPGEDHAILAGMIHIIIAEKLYDHDFVTHNVIACKQTLETPGMSQSGEAIKYFGSGIGFPNAYAQYSPAVADVPHGSDLLEDWEFFYHMAGHLELDLVFASAFGFSRYQEAAYEIMPLSRTEKPDIEAMYASICAHSRIPLEEVKQYPHGHIFDSDVRVQGRDPGCEDRLECGNAVMLAQLAEVLAQDYRAEQNTPDYPFRYIPRRHNNFMNSSGRSIAKLNGNKPFNPVWMHPDDMHKVGVGEGDKVRIATPHDGIAAVVESDDTLRPGVVAIAHAFGGLVEEDDRYEELGANTGRLVRTDEDYDPITGMPRMGNIPVAISPH